MRTKLSYLAVALMTLSLGFSGCIGEGGEEGDGLTPFPEFSSVADDGNEHTLTDYTGSTFIVLFSAEWCGAPCHSTMHALNNTLDDPTVLVFSTDPQDDPEGITLEDWHERADAYDDDGDDKGQYLDYPFMKGVEAAQEIEVTARPTVVFVNAGGGITDIHKGSLTDEALIKELWVNAGGTV
tara:strand:- start:1043 stop:1588 length:546 start_codon:yes stop_codon:yes gene_type:complete